MVITVLRSEVLLLDLHAFLLQKNGGAQTAEWLKVPEIQG